MTRTARTVGLFIIFLRNKKGVSEYSETPFPPQCVQPRRVLPEAIHFAFHNNRLTPTQALRELVQIVQIAARQKGRPFTSVLELLPRSDEEHEDENTIILSPEEQLLLDLVNLAITIRDDGQVNPLTVVDVSQEVTRLFRIETGERRYWATWLLRDFISEYKGTAWYRASSFQNSAPPCFDRRKRIPCDRD